MSTPIVSVIEHPDAALADSILRPLAEFNVDRVGLTSVEPFAVVLTSPDDGSVIGGLWANSSRGWLSVELLFVPDSYRRRGIGSSLMASAEEAAMRRGCVGVRLETFTFQSPGFYERLGYTEYGRLDNCPMGHALICMYKALPSAIVHDGSLFQASQPYATGGSVGVS